ncbi:uncharacterized protein BX664DRAFT_371563 [Halteromyces radiatus]|uniref:uncharacterized protein n=1 Tax=Halteromyces radiatus TaxID=101107 RepID=UPI00221EA9AB|nr:uncharacterized protein BX664DRAFT_371563 [Halteromyces radiatus]KAI8092743.1 hypothetical protein BX664DRAFT_371563 [Halteromyces radiatus]
MQNIKTVYITSHYGWDQNEKTIMVYLSIPNADTIQKENYSLDVKPRSVHLCINDHQGSNYSFKLTQLCGELESKETKIKFKPNKIVLYLQKKEIGKYWNDLKIKSVRDVYNQLERKMKNDAHYQNTIRKDEKDGDGQKSTLENVIHETFENKSPMSRQTAEKLLQQTISNRYSSDDPFIISDLIYSLPNHHHHHHSSPEKH